MIHYGAGALQQLGPVARQTGTKALLITDGIMQKLGHVKACTDQLLEVGIQSSVYAGVNAEPTDLFVNEAVALYHEAGCDVIISIGGGSCIDTAKAVSILATNPGDIGDFMGGARIAASDPVPHIAIPTTAGTGSEATDVTVITENRTHVKMMIKQPALMPAVAIVDPLLTLSAPKQVTAATGIDALSHAIEAYLSKRAHPMTDTLAVAAMQNIIPAIKRAYDDHTDTEARLRMSLGSLQAGMAFSNASVCLVHGMSRPIGALFHVPHGVSNAMLLPAVLEYSQDACKERLAVIGRLFLPENGVQGSVDEDARLATEKIRDLAAYVNTPNLRDWGIDQETFYAAMPKMARDAIASGSPANNPKVPDEETIISLYTTCYDYAFTTTSPKS